ncbi:MAG: hypothetical protein Q9218_006912 [Villophora microphyllina]
MEYHPTESPSRDVLSSDLENSFFRSWALRTRNSEYSSTSSISPGTRTPLTSSVSPKTVVVPRRLGRPGIEPRSTESHVPQVKWNPAQRDFQLDPSFLSSRTSEITSHERRPTKTRESVGSSISKGSSNASSKGKRALKLIRRSTVRPLSSTSITEPIPLKNSRSWKRELSGHWLEIRVGKTPNNAAKSPDAAFLQTPHAPCPTPEASSYAPSRPHRVTYTTKPQTPLSQSIQRSTDSSSPETKTPKSLVDRTRRLLGIKSSISLSSSSSKAQARRHSKGDETAETLHRASSALRELVDKFHMTPPSTSTSTSNLSVTSIAVKSTHGRKNLLRPGYRRSRATGHSSSSSVRRVMFGNPPVTTPNMDDMYTASDSQQYFRVDLTDPNGPAYLPSEARRINTPPLPEKGSKLRGFFFDYNAPSTAPEQQIEGNPWSSISLNNAPLPHRQLNYNRPTTPRSPGARLQRNDEDIDWFRVKVAIDEQVDDEREKFELNVPEHLPSSPLCPRNPKHKSGGKGVCVYHGRNKTRTDDVDEEGLWR